MTFLTSWSENEKQILRDHYGNISTSNLHKAIPGRSFPAVLGMVKRLELRKSADRLREMGRDNVRKRWDKPRPEKTAS